MTMTYKSSTEGSTTANPPCLLYSVVGGRIQYPGVLHTSTDQQRGGKVWLYVSTNAQTDVDDAGAFSDGGALGMKPGDILLGVVTGIGGIIVSTDMYPYIGILNSTESSLTTAAYNICSNYTT